MGNERSLAMTIRGPLSRLFDVLWPGSEDGIALASDEEFRQEHQVSLPIRSFQIKPRIKGERQGR